ncbi:TRAP transporter permease [Fodinicurvata sp. EGI_FJ10296]|uniref:TRAP transporter permease n=1 Tax=Fodinicurvata sp. EGI_FJ10296 TaxID=3231908 RepID=UPI003454EBBD
MLNNRFLFGLLKPIADQSRVGIDDLIEGQVRGLAWWRASAVAAIGVGLALYHLNAGFFGTPEALLFRSTHLSAMLVLAYLLVPCCKTPPASPWQRRLAGAYDAGCLATAVVMSIVIYRQFPDITARVGWPNATDQIIFPILAFLVLEGVRRTLGWTLTILTLLFIFYAYYGNYFPGLFEHRGFSHHRVTGVLFVESAGVYGLPIAVTATYVMLFLIFAAFLLRSGAGNFFTDLAFGLAGRYSGGPAKAAVWSSCFMGSLSGAPVANVVSTGAITIPLMKKVGYRPTFAAAVEAVASTGGAFMPPIMGAAAFIMAEYTRTDYSQIILYAIWPAILYYICCTLIVHFEAKRMGLVGHPAESLPIVSEVLLRRGHLLLPIVVLIWYLSQGYTPAYAASYATLALFVLVMLRPDTRMNVRDFLAALELSVRIAVPTVMACAAAGFIMGTITLTGLGVKLTSFITLVAGESLFLGLVFTMLAALVMGMGMTTTSVYVIVAVLCVPALVNLGADLISAHFFVLYFGMLSNITPPIALAAYAAASIAQADPWRTGFEAFRIGFPAFLLPFAFVYAPELLLRGSAISVVTTILVSLGVVLILAKLASFSGTMIRTAMGEPER